MQWFFAHKQLALAFVVGGVVLAGASFVADRFATTAPAMQQTWTGLSGTQELRFDPTAPSLRENTVTEDDVFSSLVNDRINTHLTTTMPNVFALKELPTATSSYTFSEDDIVGLLSTLTPSAAIAIPVITEDEEGLSLSDVYAYLPQGLTSISTPTKKMTGTQLDLYEYGNRAGSYIESFGDQFGNYQNATIRRFLEDRANEAKVVDVDRLGKAFVALGKDLHSVENVPTLIAQEHKKMADGYIAVGEATRRVALAKTDDELLAAILFSNTASDTFVKAYIAIAEQFSVFEVHYRDSEPGKVFVFTTLQ